MGRPHRSRRRARGCDFWCGPAVRLLTMRPGEATPASATNICTSYHLRGDERRASGLNRLTAIDRMAKAQRARTAIHATISRTRLLMRSYCARSARWRFVDLDPRRALEQI